MCGIAGIFNFDNHTVDEHALHSMNGLQAHRGPNDRGIFSENEIGLAHTRLSILDLSSAGHQPMKSTSGRFVLTFNGEIYNYLELKRELRSQFTFKTETDTEVLLAAFEKWGPDCLDKLNGMFAFAIWDRKARKLFLARDRFGIKPLYYYQNKKSFAFASEIKTLFEVGLEKRELNPAAAYDYFAYGRVAHRPDTFIKGVQRLQAGTCLEVSQERSQLRRWYSLRDKMGPGFETPAQLKDLLEDSVRLQLQADVPVGVCLSGGLDSSFILSLVLGLKPSSPVKTFSAVYNRGDRGDETSFIELYRPYVDEMHFARPKSQDFAHDLSRFISVLEEPVPSSSGYAEFKVYEKASRHVTVLLNGQGADETLAGYHYMVGYVFKELFHERKWMKLWKESRAFYKRHKNFIPHLSSIYFSFSESNQKKLMELKARALNPDWTRTSKYESLPLQIHSARDLREATLAHFEEKFEHHLLWGDKSSMAFGLEVRFPFLDHRYVETILGQPSSDLVREGETKWILREAMKGIVPEAIRTRQDKVGYETPEDRWFRTKEVKDLVHETLLRSRVEHRGICSPKRIESLFEKHLRGETQAGNTLWRCLHFELWNQAFLDRRGLT